MASIRICIAPPGSTFVGMEYCIIEPPDTRSDYRYDEPGSLRIDIDGIRDDNVSYPPARSADAFRCRIFVDEWNSFIAICARSVEVVWLGEAHDGSDRPDAGFVSLCRVGTAHHRGLKGGQCPPYAIWRPNPVGPASTKRKRRCSARGRNWRSPRSSVVLGLGLLEGAARVVEWAVRSGAGGRTSPRRSAIGSTRSGTS